MLQKPGFVFEKKIISSRKEIANDVFVISFKRSFSFKAGQIVAIKIRENEEHRLYSIASGENDEDLSVLFDVNPTGLLTPRLADHNIGDEILVSQPVGFFIDDDSPSWWIATGTGVAPFISMLLSGMHKQKRLVHGGRTLDSFYFQTEFENRLKENYIRCSSQEKNEALYAGRLTKYLSEIDKFDEEIKYMLCGSAEMVVEVRDLLISKGVPFTKIRAEIYF